MTSQLNQQHFFPLGWREITVPLTLDGIKLSEIGYVME